MYIYMDSLSPTNKWGKGKRSFVSLEYGGGGGDSLESLQIDSVAIDRV